MVGEFRGIVRHIVPVRGHEAVDKLRCVHGKARGVQRKFFTTPLLAEANKRRVCNQFTKKKDVAKEAVSAAMQTGTRQQSERICELIDAPRTKPRPCVKIMLADSEAD